MYRPNILLVCCIMLTYNICTHNWIVINPSMQFSYNPRTMRISGRRFILFVVKKILLPHPSLPPETLCQICPKRALLMFYERGSLWPGVHSSHDACPSFVFCLVYSRPAVSGVGQPTWNVKSGLVGASRTSGLLLSLSVPELHR